MAITTSSGFEAEVDTQALDRLLSLDNLDGKREKTIKALIGKALNNAKKRMSEEARMLLDHDSRQSWRAVKYSLYKNILGGNVSILSRRRAGARANIPPSRRGRMPDTERLESYLGADRGFILRIMNAAQRHRVASHMDGHLIRRGSVSERPRSRKYQSEVIGYRGVWRNGPQGFFSKGAANAIGHAAQELSILISEEITREINNYGK